MVEAKTENLAQRKGSLTEAHDPVLLMLGIGEPLWRQESGDDLVERLRSEDEVQEPRSAPPAGQAGNLDQVIWRRIEEHQTKVFHTSTGLPFTFEVQGSGIWFFRDGRRINRKLTRSQVSIAISRCPLRSTTEIKDLMDYAYLFAVLMDRRIRGHEW